MVKQYLESIRQEYVEKKISLEEEISSCENSMRENDKLIEILDKKNDPNYEAFTPREFSS